MLTIYSPSLFVLLFRIVPQWIYLTPKSPLLPPFPVTSQPYILVFFFLNLLFVVSAIISEPTAAGLATRGYLHGGFIIDFVGQLSPVSRLRLVATQLLVWLLQTIMLAVSLERRELAGESNETAAAGAYPGTVDEEPISWEDQDAAERGERGTAYNANGVDIELQPINRDWSRSDARNGSAEASDDFPGCLGVASANEHPLDSFNSGQHVIAHLDLLSTTLRQWPQRYTFSQGTSGSTFAESGSAAAVAAIVAGNNPDFRIRAEGPPLRPQL